MQTPLEQTLPASQTTPAQRLVTHAPLLHTWLPLHFTLAQRLAAAQPRLHASPVPQEALQAVSAVHLPVPLSQNCPDAQVTPAQGVAKQPVSQRPSTQVWPLPQVTPAHGSTVGTQAALQLAPPPQAIPLAFAHGSGWQAPPRQTSPLAQVAAQPPEVPPPEVPPPEVPPPEVPPPEVPPPEAPPDPLDAPPVPSPDVPPVSFVALPEPPLPLDDCDAELPHPAANTKQSSPTEPRSGIVIGPSKVA